MKPGDLVKFKTDVQSSIGLVVETRNPGDSVTFPVYVLWDFLDGRVGENWSYQLEILNNEVTNEKPK